VGLDGHFQNRIMPVQGGVVMFIEVIGSSAGIIYVWLMIRQSIWCWPASLVYIGASYIVFFNARLYAELASHTVFLILTLYGWYMWDAKKKQEAFPVTSLKADEIGVLILVNLTLGLIFGALLAKYTDNPLPYIDSIVAMMSFTGMWLSANKKIENWPLWMFVNLISIGMYFRQHLYLYVALYMLFFAMAFSGYFSWRRAKLSWLDRNLQGKLTSSLN
jgi:nicotinamide mononucleotide transporter